MNNLSYIEVWACITIAALVLLLIGDAAAKLGKMLVSFSLYLYRFLFGLAFIALSIALLYRR